MALYHFKELTLSSSVENVCACTLLKDLNVFHSGNALEIILKTITHYEKKHGGPKQNSLLLRLVSTYRENDSVSEDNIQKA